MIEFAYKDANEFLKKQEAREKKWKQENAEREKKAAESKIKREVTRTKKNLKKLNFSQEEIDAKILETYGKEFV